MLQLRTLSHHIVLRALTYARFTPALCVYAMHVYKWDPCSQKFSWFLKWAIYPLVSGICWFSVHWLFKCLSSGTNSGFSSWSTKRLFWTAFLSSSFIPELNRRFTTWLLKLHTQSFLRGFLLFVFVGGSREPLHCKCKGFTGCYTMQKNKINAFLT